MRSSNPAGSQDAIAQRGPTPDIREALKHLGPSNLASRPRQTRYRAVKIKPGGGSPAVSNGFHQANTDRPASESILRPQQVSGRSDMSVKDGVHALKSGYGTMGDTTRSSSNYDGGPPKINKSISANQDEDLPYVPLPESEDDGNGTEVHHAISSSEGVQSDNSKNTSSYQPRGPTRSGSITEQVVDVSGFRKVVLQTASGKSSQSGRSRSGERRGQEDGSLKPSGTNGSQGSDHGSGEYHEPQATNVKKKRRRKKRSTGSKASASADAESQPLLDS
jgi:metal transporter CNNM